MGCVGRFNSHKSGSVQENAPEFKERPGRTVNKCVCRDKSDPTFELHPAGRSINDGTSWQHHSVRPQFVLFQNNVTTLPSTNTQGQLLGSTGLKNTQPKMPESFLRDLEVRLLEII